MSVDKRDLQECHRRKFDFTEVKGSKHDAMPLIVAGTKVATTRFSRGGGKDLGNPLLARIAGQLRVNLNRLKAMHDCSFSQTQYVEHLRREGHLE